jgi:RNA polymerase sigma-70 factor, ECF subfamily
MPGIDVTTQDITAPAEQDDAESSEALPLSVLEAVTSVEYLLQVLTKDEALPPPTLRPPGRRTATRSVTPERRRTDPDEDVLVLVRSKRIEQALVRLMQRHGASVYRYCRVALNDAVLADDVHQQVFFEALRDLPRFAGRSSARTWILGIARHRVLDAAKQRRRSHAHLEADVPVELPDPRPSLDEALDDARLRAALVACVAELDAPVRTAILLRYQQGLSFEEMSEICHEQPGTLQARVSRALGQLRVRIEKLISDGR